MNWYFKTITSQTTPSQINSFEDRNQINKKIQDLKVLSERIRVAAKISYQTQRNAKNMLSEVGSHKRLSSFPLIVQMLNKATSIVLDSPKEAQRYAYAAADEIDVRISQLEGNRSQFTQSKTPNMLWFGARK